MLLSFPTSSDREECLPHFQFGQPGHPLTKPLRVDSRIQAPEPCKRAVSERPVRLYIDNRSLLQLGLSGAHSRGEGFGSLRMLSEIIEVPGDVVLQGSILVGHGGVGEPSHLRP